MFLNVFSKIFNCAPQLNNVDVLCTDESLPFFHASDNRSFLFEKFFLLVSQARLRVTGLLSNKIIISKHENLL